MILDLALNVALVVALGVLIGAAGRQWGMDSMASKLASGVLFAAVTLVAMMTPVVLAPGLIFDARSIILCTAGVIGGPIVAAIAATCAIAYRVYLGGVGTVMGVSVIAEAAILGSVFYFLRLRDKRFESVFALYGLGLLVHVVMIGLAMTLPPEQRGNVMRQIAVPVRALSLGDGGSMQAPARQRGTRAGTQIVRR
jgi:LytS/YehU family sensor histidine kinase